MWFCWGPLMLQTSVRLVCRSVPHRRPALAARSLTSSPSNDGPCTWRQTIFDSPCIPPSTKCTFPFLPSLLRYSLKSFPVVYTNARSWNDSLMILRWLERVWNLLPNCPATCLQKLPRSKLPNRHLTSKIGPGIAPVHSVDKEPPPNCLPIH